MKRKIPFFSVLGEARTYLNIVYILIAFPLSVVFFSLTIIGVSLSAGLLVIVAGFFIFLGTLMMVRGFRWLDVQLTRVFLGATIPLGEKEVATSGVSDFVKKIFGSSLTWKCFVYYLFIKFPLDLIIWTVSISFLALTFDLLLAPVFDQFWWYDDDLTRYLIDFFDEVYVLPFLGLVWGMISLHVVRGLAWVSREVNFAFLQDQNKVGTPTG